MTSNEITKGGLEHFNYDSGSSHLLSVLLTRATDRSTKEFAEEKLFSPLGITEVEWWQDEQLIPEKWVHQSIQEHQNLNHLVNYGYQWWIYEFQTLEGFQSRYPGFAMTGSHGQAVYVIPELDLIAVFQGDLDLDSDKDMDLFLRYIIPAVKE